MTHHAVGRDIGRAAGDAIEHVEQYLLQMWPEEALSAPHIFTEATRS